MLSLLSVLLGLAGAGITVIVLYNLIFPLKYPPNLPRVNVSWPGRWQYFTNCAALYRTAYHQYAKQDRACLVPGLGARDEIILPPSAISWLLAQPEHVLSRDAANLEYNQIQYGLGHTKYVVDIWHGDLVRTDINPLLDRICTDAMWDEFVSAIDAGFGTDVDVWREVDLWETVRMVVGRANTRITVGGSPVGRRLVADEEYLRLSFGIVDAIMMNAGVTTAMPVALRPLVGPFFRRTVLAKIAQLKRYTAPLFAERLPTLQQDEASQPLDHLQMMLRFAAKERPEEMPRDPRDGRSIDQMTKRIAAANFASMHQTSIHVCNTLLNILGSDKEHNTIALLREEIRKTTPAEGEGVWTKQRVLHMARCDSAARETMRLHAFGGRALMRMVMVDGLETPCKDGVKLPKGAIVSVLAYGAHTDEENFADAATYKPFRFSAQREAAPDPATGRPGLPNLSFVATSSTHLPFGLGRHACPGRYLVDYELKMVLAYVLTRYDVKFPDSYGGKRPPNTWMTEAVTPPPGVRICVRRRKEGEKVV